MKKLESTKSSVNKHISLVEQSLDKFGHLLDNSRISTPTDEELITICTLIHSMYNGIELILCAIMKYNGTNPEEHYVSEKDKKKGSWHSNVLRIAFEGYNTVPPILEDKEKLLFNLEGMKEFRHAFRYKYPHEFKWEIIKDAVDEIKSTWENFKEQILDYVEELESISRNINPNPLAKD